MVDPRKWKPAFGYGGYRGKQTPLEIRLVGKRHDHVMFCSSGPRTPIGSGGCVCLRMLRSSKL
jgi:hypothetical protein